MPKFYCSLNNYKNIIDSINLYEAAKSILIKAEQNNIDIPLLISINETGFYSKNYTLIPTIPILKQMGSPTPDREELIDIICQNNNIKRESINEKELNWLLTGEMKNE